MNFKSIEDIIEFALGKEKSAVEFYDELSKREKASGARETFEKFSKEEEKHVTLLENYLKDKKLLDEYEFKGITDLKISDYIVDVEYEKGMSYPDHLRLAMKREEKSYKLYTELADLTKDEEHFKIFQVLAQEELKHKNILETIYDDYLAVQGN